MKSIFLGLVVFAMGAHASPLICKKGKAVYRTIGVYPISDQLSCPKMTAACVDEAFCPKPTPVPVDYCPDNSAFASVVVGFEPVPGEPELSCPKYASGCVDLTKCPTTGQLLCKQGFPEDVVAGYKKIGYGLSCPVWESGCVDQKKCPHF